MSNGFCVSGLEGGLQLTLRSLEPSLEVLLRSTPQDEHQGWETAGEEPDVGLEEASRPGAIPLPHRLHSLR